MIPPSASIAIVDDQGKMQVQFRTFTLLLSALDIAVGTGSPEGVLEAEQLKLYMDDTGTTGSILYIKRDTDIGGDTSQGWIKI